MTTDVQVIIWTKVFGVFFFSVFTSGSERALRRTDTEVTFNPECVSEVNGTFHYYNDLHFNISFPHDGR